MNWSNTPASTAEGFVVDDNGEQWRYEGSLTFANAAEVHAATADLPLPTRAVVDCSGLATVDSSAVAVLLSIKRRAMREGMALTLRDVPAPLHALAAVYGVDEILVATEPVV